jgi:hypothetical protein
MPLRRSRQAPLASSSRSEATNDFLKLHPSLRTARLIVATDTLTPLSRSHSSQWRSRVASSSASSCAHRARLSTLEERMRGVRPGEGLGLSGTPRLRGGA